MPKVKSLSKDEYVLKTLENIMLTVEKLLNMIEILNKRVEVLKKTQYDPHGDYNN